MLVCNLQQIKDEQMIQALKDASQIRKQIIILDHGPFHGLPNKVKELLQTNRGINELYGNIFMIFCCIATFILISSSHACCRTLI